MHGLPTSIQIGCTEYKIRNNGDYRVILDCFSFLKNPELDEQYRACAALIAFYDGLTYDTLSTFFGSDVENYQKAVDEMFQFMNCYQKHNPISKDYVLYDWEEDEQLIFSAINETARREVRNPEYCHWFTFMGYFNQIGDGSFATVVSIRKKIVEHKKLEKWEKQFKRDNPQYFEWNYKTAERMEKDKEIKEILEMWNST